MSRIRDIAPDPLRFGTALRERRKVLGLTQQNVADASGTTRQLVARLEHGTPVGLESALLVARTGGIDVYLEPRS